MIYLVYAHPYPSQSRACRALLEAVQTLPGIETCSLYDRYPDFDIDVVAEQQALGRAQLVIWMHPIFWYSVPGLLKHWFDKVLSHGWAYGDNATALRGKECLWVATTGGGADAYSPAGVHRRPFRDFMGPVEETALFCGMTWQPPCILHGAHEMAQPALTRAGQQLHDRLAQWLASRAEALTHSDQISQVVSPP